MQQPTSSCPEDLYLGLLKKSLTDSIRREQFRFEVPRPRSPVKKAVYSLARPLVAAGNLELVRRIDVDPEATDEGRYLSTPAEADTMIGLKRLDNLQDCVKDILQRNVPGDLIETGVWRGGATIFMRAILKAYGDADRVVWVCDSFQGLPKPDSEQFPADSGDTHWTVDELAVSLDEVKENFARYGLLDDQVRFLPGWFKDTLPSAPIEQLAVLRLDGDMYESTMTALRCLYPKLAPGGYVIVDDYEAVAGCKSAVDDFRAEFGITDEIEQIDWTAVFWQRR